MAKRKLKTPTEPPPSKRRRTIKTRNRNRRRKTRHDYVNRADAYARHYVAAAIMAEIARRLGNPTVSPRDFYCGCAPCFKDGLPMCEGERPNCRFANRPPPEILAARETQRDEARYDELWSLATLCYDGPDLPRGSWGRRC